MAAIDSVIGELQGRIANLTGIRSAPTEPPETINFFPFVVAYPESGIISRMDYHRKKELHNVAIEVHLARKDLPRDYDNAMSYYDNIVNEIVEDPTFGGYAETFDEVTYEFGELGYGNTQTIGWKFIIQNIKIEETI